MQPLRRLFFIPIIYIIVKAASEGGLNEDYSTVEKLRGAVREERNRELVGEGFRMHDLKRWEMNVVRGASQSPSLTKPGADYGELEKPYNHSRALWPIPKTEIDANPQIKNQQNPGY